MLRFLLLVAALSAALVAPRLASADEFERSIAVGPGERLRIELAQGDVDVFTHDAPEVRIEARARGLGASGVEFFVTHEDGQIVLKSRGERWLEWLGSGPRVSVRAWVPRHLGLAVETNGTVAARDGGVLIVPAVAEAPRPDDGALLASEQAVPR